MSAYRPLAAWTKVGVPKPDNFDELYRAALARQRAEEQHDVKAQRTAAAEFAHEFGVLASDARAAGYPPPTLIGWLDEETGEVQ